RRRNIGRTAEKRPPGPRRPRPTGAASLLDLDLAGLGDFSTSAAHTRLPGAVSLINRLRRVPIPVISISTTSPSLRSGEAPSVPIQITSPGHSVKYLVNSTMN